MTNYRISEIRFDEEIGIAVSCQWDNDFLRFVFDCIARTAAGEAGDISTEDALRSSNIPKEDTEGVLVTAWTLPKPIITVHNTFATWLMIWFEIPEGCVSFGFYGPE